MTACRSPRASSVYSIRGRRENRELLNRASHFAARSLSRDRAMLLFKLCAVCDAAFVPTRRDAKFCRSGCRQASYRARKAAKATEANRAADLAVGDA
jgi:hypothetical protein